MQDETINVAFSITDSYGSYLGVVLYSLLQNNKGAVFNFFILSSDLSSVTKSKVRKVVEMNPGCRVSFISPKVGMFENLPITIDHITKETYFRYSLASLLPKCKKVIYMDVDLLVLGSIRDLWSIDMEGFYVAGSTDLFIRDSADEFYNKDHYNSYKESIGLTDSDAYVNAGVLLLNLDKIRLDNKEAELFRNTKELSSLIRFQDQDIINVTFRGHIKSFDCIYNYTERDALEGLRSSDEVRVIHFNGPFKPWADGYRAHSFMSYFADKYMIYESLYRDLVEGVDPLRVRGQVKYALFSYKTDNIGDEIQSVAARRFLPRVDYYVDRDGLDQLKSRDATIKLIMNGWYSHNPGSFPPNNPAIEPLLVSMYVADHVKDRFASDRNRFFLNKYGPVGARNTDTQDYFSSIGVDSYFSGCLTLTLQKSPSIKKRNFILAVDVPDDVLATLREKADTPVLSMGAFITTENMSREQRFALAEYYLYLYQSAKCVVTTRLHATLPCLALGTPVLNLEKENFEPGRFAGLRELAHHMTVYQFLENPDSYNINKPPANPKGYLRIRKKLEETCTAYTGYVNNDGFLTYSVDELLHSVDLLQPITSGLSDRYELDYVDRVVREDVGMVNHHIRIANEVDQLRQDRDRYKTLYSDIINSRSWKVVAKINRVRDSVYNGIHIGRKKG